MNYNKKISINTVQSEAFYAVLKKINDWWGTIDYNQLSRVGDEFQVSFSDGTSWKFKIVFLNQYDEIRWKCIEANHKIKGLTSVEKEWLGTEIIWKLSYSEYENNTIISFEHDGLTPQLACYETCNQGWDYFLDSLKQYLETGKGTPNSV